MAGEQESSKTDAAESRDAEQLERSLHAACLCAQIADNYRGHETVVLDLTRVTPIVDFFVITSGTNKRQLHAIAEEVDRVMEERGWKRLGLEGYRESSWILQDYGDVCLHVFDEASRELYDLENLWGDAERVDWQAVLATD